MNKLYNTLTVAIVVSSFVANFACISFAVDKQNSGLPKINSIVKSTANRVEKNQKAQKEEKEKPAKLTKTEKEAAKEQANPLYPAKYTPKYIEKIQSEYKCAAKNELLIVALDLLKNTDGGEFSRKAILGNNLSKHPIKIEFKDLSKINPNYSTYDALGWKRGHSLYIYINEKHSNSPAIALAPVLAHEALHQDQYNSVEEETYAWTLEAAVWCELLEIYYDYDLNFDALVDRENKLKKLFEKGAYSSKYIRKAVVSNEAYRSLPQYSPGFENL